MAKVQLVLHSVPDIPLALDLLRSVLWNGQVGEARCVH